MLSYQIKVLRCWKDEFAGLLTNSHVVHEQGGSPPSEPRPAPGEGEDRDAVGDLFGSADEEVEDWSFEAPYYVLDKKAGRMWALAVHLEHFAMSCVDKVNLCRYVKPRS